MLLAKGRTRDGALAPENLSTVRDGQRPVAALLCGSPRRDDRQGDGGADQPLRDVERCGPHHRMENARTVDWSSRSKNSPVVRTNVLSDKVLGEADSIEKNRKNSV